jgi:hypothetical protein
VVEHLEQKRQAHIRNNDISSLKLIDTRLKNFLKELSTKQFGSGCLHNHENAVNDAAVMMEDARWYEEVQHWELPIKVQKMKYNQFSAVSKAIISFKRTGMDLGIIK